MFEETPPTPPAIAARESTSRILCVFGGLPASSSKSPSAPTATIVPIVSKKSASMTEKARTTTATTPIFANGPEIENSPRVEKSGV